MEDDDANLEEITPTTLREQAALARRLAQSLSQKADRALIARIADELEAEATARERRAS